MKSASLNGCSYPAQSSKTSILFCSPALAMASRMAFLEPISIGVIYDGGVALASEVYVPNMRAPRSLQSWAAAEPMPPRAPRGLRLGMMNGVRQVMYVPMIITLYPCLTFARVSTVIQAHSHGRVMLPALEWSRDAGFRLNAAIGTVTYLKNSQSGKQETNACKIHTEKTFHLK